MTAENTTHLKSKSELIVLLHEIKQLVDQEKWVKMNAKVWLLHQAYNALLIEIAREKNIDKGTEFVIKKEKEAASRLQKEILKTKVDLLPTDENHDWLLIKLKLLQAHLKTIQAHIKHLEEIS